MKLLKIPSRISKPTLAVTLAFSITATAGVAGLFAVSKYAEKKTVLASNYTNEVATNATDSLTTALTQNVADSVLSQSIAEYLTNDQLQNLITQRVTDYVSDDNSAQMTEAVQTAVTNAVASKIATFTAAQKNEILGIVEGVVDDKLSNVDVTQLSDIELEKVTASVIDQLSESDALADVVANLPINLGALSIDEILHEIDIPALVLGSSTSPNLSRDDVALINEVVREQVTTLLKNIIGSEGLDGLDANSGTNSNDSSSGSDGTSGTNGVVGIDGKDGADGKDGEAGKDGADGKDGKDGVDGKTPVKGTDYFTDSEIKDIIAKSSSSAAKTVNASLSSLQKSINTLSAKIDTVESSVKKLSASTSSGSTSDGSTTDVTSLIAAVNSLNKSVADIYTNIDITETKLSLKTAKDGSIYSTTKVDTANMSIADALSLLSNNGTAYTQAINQLWYTVEQLKKNVGGKYEQLDAAIAGLTDQTASNDGKIIDIFNSVAIYKQNLIQQREEVLNTVAEKQQNVLDCIEQLKQALQNGSPEEIEQSRDALQNALNEYNTYLQNNYDILSTEQRAVVDKIYNYINNINNALHDNTLSVDDLLKQLSANGKDISITSNLLMKLIAAAQEDLRKEIASLQKEILDIVTDGESSVIKDFTDSCKNYQTIINDYTTELNEAINYYQLIINTGTPEEIAEAKDAIIKIIEHYKEFLGSIDGDSKTQAKINDILKYLDDLMSTLMDSSATDEEISGAIDTIREQIIIASNDAILAIGEQLHDYETQLNVLIGNNAASNAALQELRNSVDEEVNNRVLAVENLQRSLNSQRASLAALEEQLANAAPGTSIEDLDLSAYTTLEELQRIISDNSVLLENYTDEQVGILSEQLDTALGLMDPTALASISDIQESIVSINDTLSTATGNLQAGIDDLYACIAVLGQNNNSEQLERIAADQELSAIIGESVTDYNKKIQDLEYAVLDGDEGAIAVAKQELMDICDDIAQQLESSTDSLSHDLQREVSAVITDLTETKTNLSANIYKTTNDLIDTINSRDSAADTWCYGITLRYEQSGTSSYAPDRSVIYPNYADSDKGYQWIITSATGLNITEDADIQLFYNKDTIENVTNWGTSIKYKVNNGTIVITVPAGYYKTVKGDFVIDTIHCTNPNEVILNVEETE